MTDLHPALAEAVADIDREIAEHQADIEHCQRRIDQHASVIAGLQMALVAYRTASKLITMHDACPEPGPRDNDEPPAPPIRTRHDVRGAVAAYLGVASAIETAIVVGTGLPEASVHAYLLRAVRAGELVRDGEMYRLARPALVDPQDVGPIPIRDRAIDETQTSVTVTLAPTFVPARPDPEPPDAAHVLDFIRRCSDMGASHGQLQTIGAAEITIQDLLADGEIVEGADGRYRIAEDREEVL